MDSATHPSSWSRRRLLRGGLTAAAVAGAGGLLAACGGGASESAPARSLTPAFYDWILSLFPIREVSKGFSAPVNVQQAPVSGFGIEAFLAEAKQRKSSWDVYVGMTPFIEMAALADSGIIVPWDDYLPAGLADTWIPSVRQEATYKGHIYSFPFDVSLVVAGLHKGIVAKAGLDPSGPPKTWDDWIDAAKKIKQSGAAPFGCSFDANGWRSIAPVAHSISLDVYTGDGLFDFTNDAVVEALQIMGRMMPYANPNVLDPGSTDGGANLTPDEGAFAAQKVGLYFKHTFGPINMASKWPDPSQLRIGALPTQVGGAGGTAFWSTGAALFRFGQNKKPAAGYMEMLTKSDAIHQSDVGNKGSVVGQLPPYRTLWDEWATNPPSWRAEWATVVYQQLTRARAIQTNKFGQKQFVIARPHWETYLRGEERDPRAALKKAMDAVHAAVRNG